LTKTLDTIVEDIYGLFENPDTFNPTEEQIDAFGKRLAAHITTRVGEKRTPKNGTGLRGSALGTDCDRKSWYENHTEDFPPIPIPPNKRLSFLYGDIIEEMLLFLVEQAGHTVSGAQDTIEVDGIIGHRDCIIDGVTVDVKSSASFGMAKFKDHELSNNDPFGYLHQLSFYLEGSQNDPTLTERDYGAFLVMDKQHGHLVVDTYHKSELPEIQPRIAAKRVQVDKPSMPLRLYSAEPDGSSGNMKLGTVCSYCNFHDHCWPNLRTFLYSNGPRFLTKVAKRPQAHIYEVPKDE